MTVLAIALGGALGALARFVVDRALPRRGGDGFPRGTLVVNLVGSLALGLVLGGLGGDGPLAAFLGTGLCGALTTWSTLALEAATTTRTRPVLTAAYVVSTLVGGVALAALGLSVTGGLTA